MSRHTHRVERNGVLYEVACGYDKPLQEYFLQVYDLNHPRLDDEDGLVFSISSHSTLKCHPKHPGKRHWTNAEILELMREWECDKEHQDRVALDLPF